MADWFEEWFGEEYLRLYPHRNDADAERLVQLLRRTLPWKPGWRVLDVASGAGRHMRALAQAGAHPIGLDLSASLLRRAREEIRAPLIRADMRWLPVRSGTMDLTVNLFTSFGYFESDQDHVAALAEMTRTVKPTGWFALDFFNAEAVLPRLVPEERVVLAGAPVEIRRRLSPDHRFVIKTIMTEEGREFTERVRLFSPRELETMLAAQGVTATQRFGDYEGAPLGEGSRAVLVGRRA